MASSYGANEQEEEAPPSYDDVMKSQYEDALPRYSEVMEGGGGGYTVE